MDKCLKAVENVESNPGWKNYHFQKFGLVENCLLDTFNCFSALYYQGNRKNSTKFYMKTCSSENST